jgi:hypothetical protein
LRSVIAVFDVWSDGRLRIGGSQSRPPTKQSVGTTP